MHSHMTSGLLRLPVSQRFRRSCLARPGTVIRIAYALVATALGCQASDSESTTTSALGEIEAPSYLDAPTSSTSGHVTVTWGASPTHGVDLYELEQSPDGEAWTTVFQGLALETELHFVVDLKVQLRVRGCLRRTGECSGYTPPVVITITPRFPDLLSSPYEDTCQPPWNTVPAQENVGATPAEANVSGGSATYRIPIALAPGRKGVQPSVALVYDSRSGNGVAGMGFSLSAASRIHRCPRTPVHDGEVGEVGFTAADRLCLDGERLILVEGTGSYGTTGSQYRTEIDRFARITMHGDINGSSTWFEVERKSGMIDRYGAVYGYVSALESYGGTTLTWWLRQSEDRQHNSVHYAYTTLSGQFVLDSISYTGVEDALGDRVLSFEYEGRPDKSTRYQAGRLLRTTQRLHAITSRVQTDIVRRYELGYGTSLATGRSLLTSLTECTSNPCSTSTELPPTTLAYDDTPPAFEEQLLPNGDGDSLKMKLGADYEGDGTRDLYRIGLSDPWGSAEVSKALYLSSEPGQPPISFMTSPCADSLEHTYDLFPGWGNRDFDQDGRADLLGVRADGTFAICDFAGNETGSDLVLPATFVFHVGDFNGDGRSDLVIQHDGQTDVDLQCPPLGSELRFCEAAPFPTLATAEQVANLSDYDGDGLPDAFVDWNGSGPPPPGYLPRDRLHAGLRWRRHLRRQDARHSRRTCGLLPGEPDGGELWLVRSQQRRAARHLQADGERPDVLREHRRCVHRRPAERHHRRLQSPVGRRAHHGLRRRWCLGDAGPEHDRSGVVLPRGWC